MKKYVLIGDYVRSQHDQDVHFIDAHELCRLYNLNPDESIFSDARESQSVVGLRNIKNLKVLTVRYDGNYTL